MDVRENKSSLARVFPLSCRKHIDVFNLIIDTGPTSIKLLDNVSLDKMSKVYYSLDYQDKCFYIELSFIDIEKSIVQQCNNVKEFIVYGQIHLPHLRIHK